MSEELTIARETSETNLRRTARRMRRDLEALSERHASIDGLTPEGKDLEIAEVLQRHHGAAEGIRTQWAAVVRRSASLGEQIPDAPDLSLVDRILTVRTLDDAAALVASLEA